MENEKKNKLRERMPYFEEDDRELSEHLGTVEEDLKPSLATIRMQRIEENVLRAYQQKKIKGRVQIRKKDFQRGEAAESYQEKETAYTSQRVDPERMNISKNRGIVSGFGHAIDGVLYSATHEKNMRFDIVVAGIVLFISLFFNFTKLQFAMLSFSIFFVLAAETFNTAVEHVCDLIVGDRYNVKVKIAKDAAAGAVFLAACNAVIVGYLLFFDKVANITGSVYTRISTHPVHSAVIALMLIFIIVVILKVFLYRGHGTPLRGGAVSGHAALAFGLATISSILSKRIIVSVISYLLAILVAQSRYEGKIHTLTEILLGVFVGTGVALIVFLLFTNLKLLPV